MLRAKSSSRVGELALRRALVDVRVPAAEVGERHLEADVGLRELRDLLQRLAERRCAGSRRRWPAGTATGRPSSAS